MFSMARGNTAKDFLLAALGGISWGLSGVCSQYLFTQYALSADWLTAVRMVLSGVALLLIAFSRERAKMFRIWGVGRDVRWLLAFGLAGLLLCQYTFLAAIKYSNSATAAVLQSLNVVMMAIVMAVWNKKPIGRGQVLAVLLAAAGVVSYTLLSRPIIASWGNLTITGWGMLIGGLVLFLFTKAWNVPAALDLTAWIVIAVIVLIGTAVGFSVFLESMQYIGPVKSTLIGCLEPVSSMVFSVAALKTQISWAAWIGFALILCTVFLSVSEKEDG